MPEAKTDASWREEIIPATNLASQTFAHSEISKSYRLEWRCVSVRLLDQKSEGKAVAEGVPLN
jgi:hypothetical protein